jgi:hypothetical protein
MANNNTGSQIAENGSSINNSKNTSNISVNKIRKEAILISFVVGALASLLASYVYEHFLR